MIPPLIRYTLDQPPKGWSYSSGTKYNLDVDSRSERSLDHARAYIQVSSMKQ